MIHLKIEDMNTTHRNLYLGNIRKQYKNYDDKFLTRIFFQSKFYSAAQWFFFKKSVVFTQHQGMWLIG